MLSGDFNVMFNVNIFTRNEGITFQLRENVGRMDLSYTELGYDIKIPDSISRNTKYNYKNRKIIKNQQYTFILKDI